MKIMKTFSLNSTIFSKNIISRRMMKMGHFNYTNARFRDTNCIAVKCDICKTVLWTEITGFEFGQHIGVAREHGWEHIRNKDGKWIDMCYECARLYREKKRREYFGVANLEVEE